MRRPGRSRAHERQRQNRVPFVRDGGADKPRRGGVFPRGDSQSGPLAPFLLDRQQFHDSPMNSSAIQNHRPSHRPSSTSLIESSLRGSAGCAPGGFPAAEVPFSCDTPLRFTEHHLAPRHGTKREPGGPCSATRARASRRGLSVNVSVPRWRLRRHPTAGAFVHRRGRRRGALMELPRCAGGTSSSATASDAPRTLKTEWRYYRSWPKRSGKRMRPDVAAGRETRDEKRNKRGIGRGLQGWLAHLPIQPRGRDDRRLSHRPAGPATWVAAST